MSAPIGPYSPIVSVGPWMICSGQLGLAPSQGGPPALVDGGVIAQLRQALANVGTLLDGAGADLTTVAKTTMFLTSMADYPAVNDAYAEFFGTHRPARSVVAVAGLPMGALVEVEVWAYRGDG
jgi:2-iminobutanoate/2-iminopropanoate deaminase